MLQVDTFTYDGTEYLNNIDMSRQLILNMIDMLPLVRTLRRDALLSQQHYLGETAS